MNETTLPSAPQEPQGGPAKPLAGPVNAPRWSELALEQIKLQKHRNGTFGLKSGVYWVTEKTLRSAWRMFWLSAPGLDPNTIYDAEGLAGTPDWNHRPKGERIAIGRSFKYFSVHRVLPIVLVNPEKKCNFKYRLNTGLEPTPITH